MTYWGRLEKAHLRPTNKNGIKFKLKRTKHFFFTLKGFTTLDKQNKRAKTNEGNSVQTLKSSKSKQS